MSNLKRRWFRFHLSTAILLMMTAGGILWINLPCVKSTSELAAGKYEILNAGWPVVYFESGYFRNEKMLFEPRMSWPVAILDFFCALLVIWRVPSLSEFLIRSRAVRKL